jgi:very-short-patch-repair endonuclease
MDGVPTVAVLVGPSGLSAREWERWADERGTVRIGEGTTAELCAAWVVKAAVVAVPHAEGWLAAPLGIPAALVVDRLAAMTRYDFDATWRTLPADTSRPAAVAAHAVLLRRFTDTPLSPAPATVRAFADLLPEHRWPTLLVCRDRPTADPNWLVGAVRAVEPLIAAVPELAVGIVASEAEYVAFTDRPDGTRHQTLAREGHVPVVGVPTDELVTRLTAVGLKPPPSHTLNQLTADGLSQEAATAFVDTAKAVANADESANSKAERFLFEHLNAHPPTAGLFELNVELPFRHGKRPGEADLIARRLKVVVEIDGMYWHLNPEQYRRDRRKDWLYQTHGYLVLRFLAEDVTDDLPDILAAVTHAVALRTPITPHGAT